METPGANRVNKLKNPKASGVDNITSILIRWGYHNFVVIAPGIAPMIMRFGTGIKLDVFYTMVTKGL